MWKIPHSFRAPARSVVVVVSTEESSFNVPSSSCYGVTTEHGRKFLRLLATVRNRVVRGLLDAGPSHFIFFCDKDAILSVTQDQYITL